MTSNVIPIDERRRAPRIPLDAPLTLLGPQGRRSRGRTVNASERGLLVDCAELPPLTPEEDVSVRLGVGEGEFEIPAAVVRIEEARGWVALRFTGPAKRVQRGPVRRVRRSRARPKEPRARSEARAELRAIASLAYEHALVDAAASPADSLLSWAERLTDELGIEGIGRPADNRELLHAMVRVVRAADEEIEAA